MKKKQIGRNEQHEPYYLKPWTSSRYTADIEQNIQNEEKLNNRYNTEN